VVSENYEKLNIPNVDGNDPAFTLRAQDKLAEAIAEMYLTLAESHEDEVVKEAQRKM
jgi:hypothetical protein